jgi:hypothetical protein
MRHAWWARTLLLLHSVEVLLCMAANLNRSFGLHMLRDLAPRAPKEGEPLEESRVLMICPSLASFGDRVWLPGLQSQRGGVQAGSHAVYCGSVVPTPHGHVVDRSKCDGFGTAQLCGDQDLDMIQRSTVLFKVSMQGGGRSC